MAKPTYGAEALAGGVMQFGVGGVFENAIKDFLKAAKDALIFLLEGLIDLIFEFIFFPNPAGMDGLNGVHNKATQAFILILTIGWLAVMLNIQVLPSSKMDPGRFLKRSFAGVVLVIIGRPVISQAVLFTNALGRFFKPDMAEFVGNLGSNLGGAAAGSVIALLIVNFAGVALLISAIVFIGTLLLRMFVVYVAYTLFPLIVAFWIFDAGVGKHAKKVSDMFLKATAMLLVSGVFMAAIINVGVSLSVASFGSGAESCIISLENSCLYNWGHMLPIIGIGGAMTLSTTLALFGISSLTGGGVGGTIGGAVAGAVTGGMSSAAGSLGGSGGSGGGDGGPGAGGEPAGGAAEAGGAEQSMGNGAVNNEWMPSGDGDNVARADGGGAKMDQAAGGAATAGGAAAAESSSASRASGGRGGGGGQAARTQSGSSPSSESATQQGASSEGPPEAKSLKEAAPGAAWETGKTYVEEKVANSPAAKALKAGGQQLYDKNVMGVQEKGDTIAEGAKQAVSEGASHLKQGIENRIGGPSGGEKSVSEYNQTESDNNYFQNS